jgi:electron transfer flavoprotein beta subunit
VRIVVLAKPVPDSTGQERLGPDGRLDRTVVPAVINGNDEYVLEAALKLLEVHGGEITLLAMAQPNAPETLRKGLAMGAHRAMLVTDDALAGSCALGTARVLAAALRTLEYDLVLAGADSSDGGGGVVAAAVATLLGLPYLSYAGRIEPTGEGTVRVQRLSPSGYDVIEAPMPALVVGTQVLGEPRYPTLKGIMGARSKEIAIRALADLDVDPSTVGGARATTALVAHRQPAARSATQVVRDADPAVGARAILDLLDARKVI